MRILFAFALILAFTAPASAQSLGPEPPAPADSRPSINLTTQELQSLVKGTTPAPSAPAAHMSPAPAPSATARTTPVASLEARPLIGGNGATVPAPAIKPAVTYRTMAQAAAAGIAPLESTGVKLSGTPQESASAPANQVDAWAAALGKHKFSLLGLVLCLAFGWFFVRPALFGRR